MADRTKIEWADATVNAINGCSVISPGCKRCFAMKQAHRVPFRAGLVDRTSGGQVWNGKVALHEPALLMPIRWRRPRRIFWNAHGDLFHENVPDWWIDRVFVSCALSPHHTHLILTKRVERMRDYVAAIETRPAEFGRAFSDVVDLAGLPRSAGKKAIDDMRFPMPMIHLGVSAEDQQRWDERVPVLRAIPAAGRFVSAEPLLGPIVNVDMTGIGQVIVGSESGHGAREMADDWVRLMRDQCADQGTALFVKQLSGFPNRGKPIKDMADFPADLQIREFPRAKGEL